ncbi:MAG: DUF4838 domain-containing protein [Desulfobacteraceae bacterium]|nr:DUF4838 domain-containing protein [Desulfobacteraceae bacterium]
MNQSKNKTIRLEPRLQAFLPSFLLVLFIFFATCGVSVSAINLIVSNTGSISSNLISNPTGENDLEGWKARKGIKLSKDRLHGIKISGTQNESRVYAVIDILNNQLQPGVKYRLEAKVKVLSLSDNTYTPLLKFQTNDINGKYVRKYETNRYEIYSKGTWQKLWVEFTLDTNEKKGYVGVSKGTQGVMSAVLYIKDISLIQIQNNNNSMYQHVSKIETSVDNSAPDRMNSYLEIDDNISVLNNSIHKYSIFYAANAPDSVKRAALELQEYIRKSTGAFLPIVNKCSPCKYVISLGYTTYCQNEGFTLQGVEAEGYRIVTKQNNLFIFGIDTPDGHKTEKGGVSNGTLNGTYAFLEKFLGVRWLMPGEFGEDVPKHNSFVIPVVDIKEAPGFQNRRMAHIQNENPLVQKWLQRQRQGYSLQLNHYHNFTKIIPSDLYEDHPDWFPMYNNTRPKPVGRYKLETTNQELVKAFSERVVSNIKKKRMYSESISPSDSNNWSESPESKMFYGKDINDNYSVTKLVLKFYNDVAANVGQVLPNNKLCGYIYSNYLYPPLIGVPEVLSNLYLVVAPDISYGYGLYRQRTREDYNYILQSWADATDNAAYYDLPTTFEQSLGAPNPPATDLLNIVYPKLLSLDYKGVYMYGTSWGQGALTNYMLAKLNWNPGLNADDLKHEFIERAYGKEAAPHITKMFQIIDSANKDFHILDEEADYRLTSAAINYIYVEQWTKIESSYKAAKEKIQNNSQRKRLEVLETSMILFYQYLRKNKLIIKNPNSPFYKTDSEIVELLSGNNEVSNLAIGIKPNLTTQLPVEDVDMCITASQSPLKSKVNPFLLRGSTRIVLYAAHDDLAKIDFYKVRLFGREARYIVRSENGQVLSEQILNGKQKLEFEVFQNRKYFLDIISKSAIYGLDISGCSYAIRSEFNDQLLHFNNKLTPLYFWIEDSNFPFSVSISSNSLKETAAAQLVAPDGSIAGFMDTSGRMSADISINKGKSQKGFWCLLWKQPAKGNVDDVYVKFSSKINWVVLDPENPIIERKLVE